MEIALENEPIKWCARFQGKWGFQQAPDNTKTLHYLSLYKTPVIIYLKQYENEEHNFVTYDYIASSITNPTMKHVQHECWYGMMKMTTKCNTLNSEH